MRKFSKLLTVLLTLALLCGVILSVFASAAEGESPLNITNAKYNMYTDFTTKNTSGPTPTVVWGDPWTTTQYISIDYVEGSDNSYARYMRTEYNSSAKLELWIRLTDFGLGNLRAGTSIGANDYVTIDFEIGTDKYSYEDTDGWHTVDTFNDIPEAYRPSADEAYKNLAYPKGANFGINGRGYRNLTGSAGEIWNAMPLFIVQDDASGKWYVGSANAYSATSGTFVELSNKIGEFDHITFVFKTVRTADDTRATGYNLNGTTMFAFANGDYVSSVTINGTSDTTKVEAVSPWNLRVYNFPRTLSSSLCFDNVAINHYGTRTIDAVTETVGDNTTTSYKYSSLDTKYVSDGYGIDDYISSGDYKNLGLWNCEDIVYGADYVNPNGKTPIGAEIDALDNYGTLTINKSYSNVVVPGRILAFNVVAENGAKFDLSDASLARYNVAESVDGTTTTYSVTAKADVFVNNTYSDMSGSSLNTHDNYSSAPAHWQTYREAVQNYEIVAGANGNKYYKVTMKDYYTTAGGYTLPATDKEYMKTNYYMQFGPKLHSGSYTPVNGYKYYTLDFDLGGETVYSYTQELKNLTTEAMDKVTLYATSLDQIPEAIRESGEYTEGLSYPSSFTIYRRGTANEWGGSYAVNFKKDAEGKYYVEGAPAGSNKISISNEPGVFNHFTYVIKVNYDETGVMTETTTADIYMYVNGEFLYHKLDTAFGKSPKLEKVAMNYYWDQYMSTLTKYYDPSVAGEYFAELYNKYATIWDNYASNFYSANSYNTQYLDAFFGEDFDKAANLSDCKGVVYNQNYLDPNGVIFSMDGGKSYVHSIGAANNALAGLKTDDAIVTNLDILNFTPADSVTTFTVDLLDGAQFTLSDEATNELWIVEPVDEDTVKVTKYTLADAIEFDFLDNTGKVFLTKYLLPGMKLDVADATAKMTNLFDKSTLTVKHATGWTVNGQNADGYTFSTLVGMDKKMTVTPTIVSDGAVAPTYAIYYTDADGLVKLYGDIASYPAAMTDVYDASITTPGNVISSAALTALKNKISTAPDGATLMLLYSGVLDIGGNNTISIPANKTFSIDLNGKTLIHSYGSTSDYGAKMIQLGEGTTVNLYSSVAGAQIYQARYHSKSQGGQIFAMGIFNMGDVHEATINIDGDNLKVMGGSLVYYQGGTASKAAANDGKKITVNVDGGYYYTGLRSAYAIFTTEAPDFEVNISGGATFISNNTSVYSVFSTRSAGVMKIDAVDSTFIGLDNSGNLQRIFAGALTEGSSASFKNCTIVANSTGFDSKVTIGTGCVVAGVDVTKANVTADYAFGSGYEYSVTYPKLFMTGIAVGELAVMVETDKTFVYDSANNVLANLYYLNPAVMNSRLWSTSEGTVANYFTTVIADVSAAKTVTWYDLVGKTVATQKWVDGSTLTHVAAPESVDLDWYDVVYVWDTDKVNGDTAVNPKATVGGNDIKTKYANVTLTSGMTLNIYIPMVDGIDVTGITIGGEAVAYTKEGNIKGLEGNYWVFSWDSAAASFDSAVATVSFNVTNESYGFEAEAGKADIKLDVVRYATLVAEQFDHATEEANLVLEMMNYKEAVATLLNPEYARNEATTAFYALHADCACGVGIQIDAEKEVANTEALKAAGITGATFDMVDLGVISLILNSENENLSVVVTYYDGMAVQTVDVEYNSELKAYVAKDIPAAYIDNIMSITVGEVSGQYCLAAYINSEAVPAEAKAVATALYEYAMAAEAYKHVTKAEAAQ